MMDMNVEVIFHRVWGIEKSTIGNSTFTTDLLVFGFETFIYQTVNEQ